MSGVSRQEWFDALSWTRLDVPARAAALTVGGFEQGQGARIGVGRLARILGLSRYRAGLLLRHLVELGLIEETVRDRGGEAVYRLCLPAHDEASNAET